MPVAAAAAKFATSDLLLVSSTCFEPANVSRAPCAFVWRRGVTRGGPAFLRPWVYRWVDSFSSPTSSLEYPQPRCLRPGPTGRVAGAAAACQKCSSFVLRVARGRTGEVSGLFLVRPSSPGGGLVHFQHGCVCTYAHVLLVRTTNSTRSYEFCGKERLWSWLALFRGLFFFCLRDCAQSLAGGDEGGPRPCIMESWGIFFPRKRGRQLCVLSSSPIRVLFSAGRALDSRAVGRACKNAAQSGLINILSKLHCTRHRSYLFH